MENHTDSNDDDDDECQRVVERFHSVFVSGELYCLDKEGFYFLDPNFTMISPQGRAISRSKFIDQLQQQLPNLDVEIHVHDFKILSNNKDDELSSTVLCSYQEWQRKKDKDSSLVVTARQCTTLLRKMKQKLPSQHHFDTREKKLSSSFTRWEWIYMHQTWLEGMVPVQNEKHESVNSTEVNGVVAKRNVNISLTHNPQATAKSRMHPLLVSPRQHIAVESMPPHDAKPIIMKTMVVGMEFPGVVRVLTTQGSMAKKSWLDQTKRRLQSYCRPSMDDGRYRQFALPDTCFDQAAITIQLLGRFHGTILSWTAWYALIEWSRAPQSIPVSYRQNSSSRGNSTASQYDSGVSKNSNMQETDFNYDWTFSTPFSCHVSSPSFYWKPLKRNGIDMEALSKNEKEEPILYYDDIDLYKDELHDNNNNCDGMVTCRVKIRAMPTYLYVLFRVMVRVDHVMIRVRDARILIKIREGEEDDVFRTVTWRQSNWKDLSNPCCLTWRNVFESRGDGTADDESLISALPIVQPPDHIPPYSKLVSRSGRKY